MVEATVQGDGIVRNVQYAVWRNDVEQQEGYSRELINVNAPKDTKWDEVHTSNPEPRPGVNTLMKAF